MGSCRQKVTAGFSLLEVAACGAAALLAGPLRFTGTRWCRWSAGFAGRPGCACLAGPASPACGCLLQCSIPSAGVSAPRPTPFLCWCKEMKQRKHLTCIGLRRRRSLRSGRRRARSRPAGLDSAARQQRRTALHQRICRQAKPGRRGSIGAPPLDRQCAHAGVPCCRAPPCAWPAKATPDVQRGDATNVAAFSSHRCRAPLGETVRAVGRSASDRCLRQPPQARCFLCFISLHQQRKGVGRGAETPADETPLESASPRSRTSTRMGTGISSVSGGTGTGTGTGGSSGLAFNGNHSRHSRR